MGKWLFIVFVILPLGLLSSVYAYRIELVQKGLSMAFNVPVTVAAIDFTRKGIVVDKLKIANPPGCTLKHALSAAKIEIFIDYKKSLYSMKLVIDRMEVEHTVMSIELFTADGSDSNWSRLVEELTKPSPIPISINFEIDEFLIKNIKLNVEYHSFIKGSFKPAPIKKIELENIGTDKQMSMREFTLLVSRLLLNEAASNLNLKTLVPAYFLQRFIPLPLFPLEQAGKMVQGLFEKKKKDDDDD